MINKINYIFVFTWILLHGCNVSHSDENSGELEKVLLDKYRTYFGLESWKIRSRIGIQSNLSVEQEIKSKRDVIYSALDSLVIYFEKNYKTGVEPMDFWRENSKGKRTRIELIEFGVVRFCKFLNKLLPDSNSVCETSIDIFLQDARDRPSIPLDSKLKNLGWEELFFDVSKLEVLKQRTEMLKVEFAFAEFLFWNCYEQSSYSSFIPEKPEQLYPRKH